MNASFPAWQSYRDRINGLVKSALIRAIINNKWPYVLKRSIEPESIRYRNIRAINRGRIERGIVKTSEEANRCILARNVLVVLTLDQHFNVDTKDALLELGYVLWEAKELQSRERPKWRKRKVATKLSLSLRRLNRGGNYSSSKGSVRPFNSALLNRTEKVVSQNAK